MTAKEAQDYFENIATTLNAIGHTPQNKRWFRNIDEFQMELKNLPKDVYFMIMDEPKGNPSGGKNDNILDLKQFGFWILRYVEKNNFEQEDEVHSGAQEIALKIYGKLYFVDYEQRNTIMRYFRPDSFRYSKAGPELTHYFGVFCNFQVHDNINGQALYNPSEWTP